MSLTDYKAPLPLLTQSKKRQAEITSGWFKDLYSFLTCLFLQFLWVTPCQNMLDTNIYYKSCSWVHQPSCPTAWENSQVFKVFIKADKVKQQMVNGVPLYWGRQNINEPYDIGSQKYCTIILYSAKLNLFQVPLQESKARTLPGKREFSLNLIICFPYISSVHKAAGAKQFVRVKMPTILLDFKCILL